MIDLMPNERKEWWLNQHKRQRRVHRAETVAKWADRGETISGWLAIPTFALLIWLAHFI